MSWDEKPSYGRPKNFIALDKYFILDGRESAYIWVRLSYRFSCVTLSGTCFVVCTVG